MDVLGSEYSSGCESGWTVYLDQSFTSPSRDTTGFVDSQGEQEYKDKRLEYNVEEEEEDLSMVSDASSGPPQDRGYFNEGNGYFYHPPSRAASNKMKVKEQRRRKDQKLPSFLDDTASSPVFNYKNDRMTRYNEASMESVLDFSQGFSSNFEGRSAFQDHYRYLQPSGSRNQLPNNQWFEEKIRMR